MVMTAPQELYLPLDRVPIQYAPQRRAPDTTQATMPTKIPAMCARQGRADLHQGILAAKRKAL